MWRLEHSYNRNLSIYFDFIMTNCIHFKICVCNLYNSHVAAIFWRALYKTSVHILSQNMTFSHYCVSNNRNCKLNKLILIKTILRQWIILYVWHFTNVNNFYTHCQARCNIILWVWHEIKLVVINSYDNTVSSHWYYCITV